jgi:hypothetical protein
MEGSKIQSNKLLAQSNGEFWYRRRGTQSKGRRGNLYRGMGPPHVNQTPHHPGSPPATSQPAQSALSLSRRAATPTAGDGRLRQLGRHRLEPDRGTPILLCPARYRPHPSPHLSHPRACLCMRARASRSVFSTRSGAGARNSTRRARLQEPRPRPASATS